MSKPASTNAAVDPPTARRHSIWHRLLHDPVGVASLVVLGLVALIAALAPVITSKNPTDTHVSDVLAPMSGTHPLGADGLGRDILAELVYGARTSLLGALLAVAVIIALGVPAGVLAGYYRGRVDAVLSFVANALMALPVIVVLLVVLARVGRSTYLAMVVFGFLLAPAAFRLIRASVIAVREELYVDAARVSGLSNARIMRRHILPVVIAPTVIQAAQFVGVGIIVQAGIEYLGLGSANQASWGSMLNDAQQNIFTKPVLLVWPGVAIALTVVACSLLGNALRDALGVRAPVRRRRPAATGRKSSSHEATASTAPADALFVLDGLQVSYERPSGPPTTVVDGVSLTVRKGEILGLVGESGSGKSQTAFAILGLLGANANVAADHMVFDGQELSQVGPVERNRLRGRRIAYIPQEPMSNLDPAFRIGFQLTEPMRHHLKLSAKAARAEAIRLLGRVGITDPERVFNAYPHEVSGGMAQRVLIAGAVSCNPDLLIADEPTTALDVTVQAEVLDVLRDLQSERGMGVILVTHNFGVVADLCDTVAVMQRGRIVETAPVEQLFEDPQHEYTRLLLSSTLEDAPPRNQLNLAAIARSAQDVTPGVAR